MHLEYDYIMKLYMLNSCYGRIDNMLNLYCFDNFVWQIKEDQPARRQMLVVEAFDDG